MNFLPFFAVLALSLGSCGSASAEGLEADKMQHFAASLVLAEGFAAVSRSHGSRNPYLDGFLLSISVGLAKEVTDSEFDGEDFLVDVLGAATPLLLRWDFP